MQKKSLMDLTGEDLTHLEESSRKLGEAQSEEELHGILLDMLDTMGVEPLWRTPEEFDALMTSDEPIIL